jgi:drug/metabolite transporter (DMT)-like permease
MTGIIVAFIAQIFIGASLVFDKVLLKSKATAATLTYVFWIGILEGSAALLIPFGFHFPALNIVLLSLLTGAIYLAALFSYYLALKFGEASQSLAIVGGFTPIATLLFSNLLLLSPLNIAQKIAFCFLVAGGFALFLSEKINFRKILPWVLLSSVLFGLSNVLGKIVFNNADFVSGFVMLKASTLIAALLLLLIPAWRDKIVFHAKIAPVAHKFFYFVNRLLAGAGSVLIFYAISLTHPAIVDAISGSRYVIIFILALLFTKIKPAWLKEKFGLHATIWKTVATLLIVIGLSGLGLQSYYENKPVPPPTQVLWGVTFSPLMSKNLGLDWHANYSAIINDLKPSSIRIVGSWDTIEPKQDLFDFSELDWQMTEAEKAKIPVIIVIGQKTPRWPECKFPSWLDANNELLRENSLLKYENVIVNRYKDRSDLLYWQVENEPFLPFGECPVSDSELLDREIALVKSIDPAHPILLTDGGEFGDWYRAAKRADVFGTTLYRTVYNKVFGHITYPLTPESYPLKESLIKFLTKKPDEKFIVIELGLEPWTKKQIYEISPQEQLSLFNVSDFNEMIEYAKQARFDDYYLWGAEWWYAMKEKYGHPEFWEAAGKLIESGNR